MKKRSDKAWYALFVLPLVFVFTTVVIIPFIMGIGYSFYSWDGMGLSPKIFVGFDNYVRIFSDNRFVESASHTIVFFIVVASITLLQVSITKRKEVSM